MKRILLLSSAYNSLCQRYHVELTDRGHPVWIQLATNDEQMEEAVARFKPDIIFCPMLTTKVPRSIWEKHLTLIVHPGIKGDRGMSSLDWAILEGKKRWGVTLMEASDKFDAGRIWATRTFALRNAKKSSKCYSWNG